MDFFCFWYMCQFCSRGLGFRNCDDLIKHKVCDHLKEFMHIESQRTLQRKSYLDEENEEGFQGDNDDSSILEESDNEVKINTQSESTPASKLGPKPEASIKDLRVLKPKQNHTSIVSAKIKKSKSPSSAQSLTSFERYQKQGLKSYKITEVDPKAVNLTDNQYPKNPCRRGPNPNFVKLKGILPTESSRFIQTNVNDDDKTIHVCTICDKVHSKKHVAMKHFWHHIGHKRFKCSQCDKSFYTSTIKREHENSHSGCNKHECKYCGKLFQFKSGLVRHEKVKHKREQFKTD